MLAEDSASKNPEPLRSCLRRSQQPFAFVGLALRSMQLVATSPLVTGIDISAGFTPAEIAHRIVASAWGRLAKEQLGKRKISSVCFPLNPGVSDLSGSA